MQLNPQQQLEMQEQQQKQQQQKERRRNRTSMQDQELQIQAPRTSSCGPPVKRVRRTWQSNKDLPLRRMMIIRIITIIRQQQRELQQQQEDSEKEETAMEGAEKKEEDEVGEEEDVDENLELTEMEKRIAAIAKYLEMQLYRFAESSNAYTDESTLNDRIEKYCEIAKVETGVNNVCKDDEKENKTKSCDSDEASKTVTDDEREEKQNDTFIDKQLQSPICC